MFTYNVYKYTFFVWSSQTTLLKCQIFESKNHVSSQVNCVKISLSHSKSLLSIIKWINKWLRKETGLLFIAILQTQLLPKYFLEIPYLHLSYYRTPSSFPPKLSDVLSHWHSIWFLSCHLSLVKFIFILINW